MEQFKVSMNGANGLVSEEQFFKEYVTEDVWYAAIFQMESISSVLIYCWMWMVQFSVCVTKRYLRVYCLYVDWSIQQPKQYAAKD